jgi:DNA-binding CsgD family transcriptional regulator
MQRLRADAVSERQRRILDGIAAGKSNGVLADELGITVDGVKWHVSEMLWDTGCSDRHELADWWRREGPNSSAPIAFWPFGRASHAFVISALRVTFMAALTAAIVGGIYLAATRGSARNRSVVGPGAPVTSTLGKIAYVQDGEIWAKALPDGTPKRLTHYQDDPAAGPYAAPAWSASGDWLAYTQDNQPGVMRADGSDARAVPGAPAWSPVADRLAYTTGGGDVIVENADGSARRTVATPQRNTGGADGVSPPIWNHDGSELAYTEQRAAPEPPGRYGGIWVAAADGGAPPVEIYSNPQSGTESLDLIKWVGPDILIQRLLGTAVAANGGTLEVLRAQPDAHPQLTPIAPRDPAGMAYAPFISEVRGSTVLVTDGLGRDVWTNKRIGLLAAVTGVFYDITQASVTATEPAFSPDGQHIAYVAMPDEGDEPAGNDGVRGALAQRKIWLMDTQAGAELGTNKRPLTSDAAYRDEYPEWSADGKQILFVRLDARNHASLWLAPAAGGMPQDVLPDWSPPVLHTSQPWFGAFGHLAWESQMSWWQPAR